MSQLLTEKFFGLKAIAAVILLTAIGSRPAFAQAVVEAPAETAPTQSEPVADDSDDSTVAMVALSSYQALMEDVDYLGELMGKPGQAKSIEGMINFFTQGQGLNTIEKDQPLGVVLQSNGLQFNPIICLPINNLDQLLEVVAPFGVMSEQVGDVLEITSSGQTLYAKPAENWVYVTKQEAALDTLPANPGDLMQPLVDKFDIGGQVMVQNIPEVFRQMAVEKLRQGLEEGLERDPEENDDEYRERRLKAEAQVDQFVQLIESADRVAFGMTIDGEQKNLSIDIDTMGLPGSDMAKEAAALKDTKTNFAGFLDETATGRFNYCVQTDAMLDDVKKAQLNTQMEDARDTFARQLGKDDNLTEEQQTAFIEAFDVVMDALEETILAGSLDAAGSMNLTSSSLSLMAAAKVVDPAKVEAGLKKALGTIEDKPGIAIEWDKPASSGLTFHEITIDIPEQAGELRQAYGDKFSLSIGVAKDAVYLGGGDDAEQAVLKAIDASQASLGQSVSPLEIVVSVKQVADFLSKRGDANSRPIAQLMMGSLRNSEADHIRISVSPIENGSRVHIEAEEGVIKAAGVAGTAAMRAQQGAGQAPQF